MPDAAISGIRLVSASRLGREEFFADSLLGKTLVRQKRFTSLDLFLENKKGLPAVYNTAVNRHEAAQDVIFCFVHDDVMITDLFWEDRVVSALESYDVVGVAGTKIRHPKQPSWYFKSIDPSTGILEREDLANLSGRVGHGDGFPPKNVSRYGPVPLPVKLLDGVMLCVKGKTLLDNALRFDEQFDFHFYDLDFCRQAEKLGLRCGTFDLSLIHKSGGNFGSEAWRKGYQSYLAKWKD